MEVVFAVLRQLNGFFPTRVRNEALPVSHIALLSIVCLVSSASALSASGIGFGSTRVFKETLHGMPRFGFQGGRSRFVNDRLRPSQLRFLFGMGKRA